MKTQDAKRIDELLAHLAISAYQLSQELEYKNPSSIYHVQKGDSNISPQMARKITDKYPEISYMYLIGKGTDLLASKDIIKQQMFLKRAEQTVKQTFNEQWLNLLIDIADIKRNQQIIIQKLSKLDS